MKICIVGTGYVGLVSGTCFAEMGNDVICVDVDEVKINKLNEGIIPIYEPGLEEMVKRNVAEGRLHFTTSLAEALETSLFCFIAVGTPLDKDGSADLQYVLSVAREIGANISDYKIVVTKSTVPVGTSVKVKNAISEELNKRGVSVDCDVVSNPEFLKEGMAIQDCMKPNRIVVGTETEKAKKLMDELYEPFTRQSYRIYFMDIPSAEMTKYAANAMLATRISFMNEMANLCERVGANIEEVRRGIGSDERIGPHFLYAGAGYGGSCFPKDVQAIIKTGKENEVDMTLLEGVESINWEQKKVVFKKLLGHFDGSLQGKKVALWGLAFKPGTDDIREAPSLELIQALVDAGASVTAYDPVAEENVKNYLGEISGVSYCKEPYSALEEADALCLVTEWQQFREPDFDKMKTLLKQPVIVDGRNQYRPEKMQELGISYYSIGR